MWDIKRTVKKGDYLYAVIKEHPNATKNGYVLLHRALMENEINRLLTKEEVVHHINNDKKDNRIENLKLMDRKKHNSDHAKENGRLYVDLLCPICNKLFTRSKNQTHLTKTSASKEHISSFKVTLCSRSCTGKFGTTIQHKGISNELKKAIDSNVIKEYRKYTE